MQKIENSRRLAPVTVPIALLKRLDRCVTLANQANPLQGVSRATLIRIAIQRLVDSIEPELETSPARAQLGLPSGTDATGMLTKPKTVTRSRV